jgi:hypothetical protein
MSANKESGCLKILTIGAGLASIFGVIIALCAWLFPFQSLPGALVGTALPPTNPPPDPTRVPPTLCKWSIQNTRLAAIKFFESGVDAVSLEARVYTKYFSAQTARYINWEVTIYHGCPPSQREPFIIEVTYFNPDGTVDAQYSSNTYVDTGWVSSIHTDAWGWDEPGSWEVGRYKVSLRVSGLLEVTDFFDIDP